MNNEIIIQTMTESFEVLKDSWERNKNSIIKCIVETEACDGNLAMDMWAYVLKNNEKTLLNDRNENINFVDEVFMAFNNKYEGSHYTSDICKTIVYHIAPHIIRNENLINIIFGSLINAGYSGINHNYDNDPVEVIPACVGGMFLQDYSPAIPVLLKALSRNNHMEDIRIGQLILKANYYMDVIMRYNIGNYIISNEVKEYLLSSLDIIKDREDRAQIALSLMAR